MKSKLLNIISLLALVSVAAIIFSIKGCNMINTGIDIKNMDLSIRPGDDFYDFATAGWRARNPMPDDYARFGAFEKLIQENDRKIKTLVTGIARRRHAEGSVEQKIGTFYNIAMDEKKLNAEGIKPIAEDMAKITAIKHREELPAFLGRFHKFAGGFWNSGVAPDMKDSSVYIFVIGQSGIGLPEREYYFDDASAEIREKYKKYLSDLFTHFGMDGDYSVVYKIEERLARSFSKKEKLRDPEKNYHKFSYADFKKRFGGFDWDVYFDARGARPTGINVAQPEALAESLKILSSAPMADIKNYLKRMLSGKASAFLDDESFELTFDFYSRTLAGQPSPKPRWRRALSVLDSTIGEAVGEAYVKKYFPPEAKERMTQLVENLRAAYAERIRGLDWMSDETKEKALEKLAAFRAKIGYPDKFRDYSGLEILNDSYWANVKRANIFDDEYWLAKLGQPVDRDIWLMNPQTVNAYYWSQTNEICFPAGILQPPFFDMNADDAMNYGAIGSVIAHEMTHGFDDSGRKFDKDGNMRDWWTAKDAAEFKARAQIMREFFDVIEVAPGLNANGEFSLGENLSDYGGVTIAFAAFQNATTDQPGRKWKGLTPEQRFFISYASIWAGHIRPEEVIRRTKTGVHSLSRWRVNGILPHVDAWYEAFGITPDYKMYIAPENRVRVW